MEKILVGAISDVHAPKYLPLYQQAIKRAASKLQNCDLLLLAGDMILKGDINEVPLVMKPLEKLRSPIIAVFGNEEYDPLWEEIEAIAGERISFLNDESTILEIKNKTIGIVGSKGVLDRPTWWQQKNIPGIHETYSNRIEMIQKLLKQLDADIKILLLHYPPTYKTVVGERPGTYPYIGSKKMGRSVFKEKIDVVVHGHAHLGKKFAFEGAVPIYNVALPLRKRFTFISLPRKSSLTSFF
ncbi:MAG: metallophosphoesterase family protein [Candidatus Helarchaeota archaeon]